jgi:glutaredoxin
VKALLSHEGVPFDEVNLREDPEGVRRLIDWGFRATPVTVIDDRPIQGFDREAILAALGKGVEQGDAPTV